MQGCSREAARSSGAKLTHRVEGEFATGMDEIDRAVCLFRVIHCAQRIDCLGDRRLGETPIPKRVASRALEFHAVATNQLDVLGMDCQHRLRETRDRLHEIIHEAVVGSGEAKIETFVALEIGEVLE